MTDLSSDELKEISEWYPSGITAVISTNKVSQMARELLQRREAAEGKPYAYEFVTKGKLLGKVCLKRVLPPVDVIDVTPLWRQPPLNSAERERLATLERVVEGLPQDAIDGGWTAVGIIAYAKSLQSELAALRQAQQGPSTAANSTAVADNDLTAALCDLAYANGAGNSPVIPDVPAIRDVIAERRRQITASRGDLVKAGALILAEIERIDRCATQSKGGK
ncbi:hypothetical protein [Dickeya ananatis]